MPDTMLLNRPSLDALLNDALEYLLADDPERAANRRLLLDAVARWDAERPEIQNEDHAEKAVNLSSKLRDAAKAEEDARTEAKKPLLTAGKRVDGTFGARRDKMRDADEGIRRRIAAWQRKLAEQQRAEQERLAREAAELAAKGQTDQAAEKAEAASKAASTKPVVRSQHGNKAILRTHHSVEVIDFAQVPHAYLILDEKKAKEALIAGTEIPGLRLKTEQRTVIA